MTEFEEKSKSFTSEKLCEIVASNRYLGIMENEAIICMTELALRRTNGDNFDYETKIYNLEKDLPVFKMDLNKILKIKWGF